MMVDAEGFLNGMWLWCALNGHSLGGAMAQIMAAEMIVEAKSRPVLLAVLGSPVAGSKEFTTILRETILPKPGGVRVWNVGDVVPWLGLPDNLKSFAGLEVRLEGSGNPEERHIRFTTGSSCVTHRFPALESQYSPGGGLNLPSNLRVGSYAEVP